MDYKLLLVTMTLLFVLLLSACGWGDDNKKDVDPAADVTNNLGSEDKQVSEEEVERLEDQGNIPTSPIPEGLKESENPKYPVGSTAVVNASHREGMEGAVATVKAAYDTTVYSVSYQPTNGEPFEENHKWFVAEELTGVDKGTLAQGSEVIINANRLEGMLGAEGAVDTVENTTVYVVDYTNSLGETITDYLWLKESELVPESESKYDSDNDGKSAITQ
ncbi:DUF1541 domain-containing protein [Lysinibacillus yapensis]|uniref:DUF1541 domain-containing protein n=1 Tax=Ureibacillus yapensis TaxID=2304605 RepID=A0A396SUD9_9BACL|nr:YdhK family protein [Lysinibacillus yapensis]RHW40101.1 DUF1541 domain-containing protein [Lysinibacillus yapensis]